mgnify:FL=1
MLANGNSTLPAYKMCKDYISRYEYRQLKQIEREYESAIEMYESIHLRRSKSTYNSEVHNTAKNKQSLLESLKMDLELDALFSA